MTPGERIEAMMEWCVRHRATLELVGECGFGRPCVGVTVEDKYLDYHWYNEDWTPADDNGDIWTPEDAYHKHPCIAVLGRGEDAERQLYEWLVWFDDNDFAVETGDVEGSFHPLELMMGKNRFARMVRA